MSNDPKKELDDVNRVREEYLKILRRRKNNAKKAMHVLSRLSIISFGVSFLLFIRSEEWSEMNVFVIALFTILGCIFAGCAFYAEFVYDYPSVRKDDGSGVFFRP